MGDAVEQWTIVGVPGLLALVSLVIPLTGRRLMSSGRAQRVSFVVLALLFVPAVAVGGVRVFAVFTILNLTIGRDEFVPFSRFGMFSTLPESRTVVFLGTADGVRVPTRGLCGVQPQELTKLFHTARFSARRQHPEWTPADWDEIGAYFVGNAILRSNRKLALPPPPADLQIMIATLTSTPEGPRAVERPLMDLSQVES